ncbi:ParB family protein [Pseudomonas silesiensis]|uniref:ParB family protein n=1 Tax=Pseudomonas silesiensis TaxID=1853130 RepID=UPI0034D499F4
MADVTPQEMAGKLLVQGFSRSGPVAQTLTAPIVETPMIVTLDELYPYELDPRITRNPLYDDIKASIRERGLDAPPSITRRPGADHYIIRNGGNTRLAILCELWSETKDERFFRIPCLFRPWPERGEIIALTGHLAENELHGGLSFIERALGIQKARELYEQETGKSLSQSELARRLKADGYPVPQPHISRMQEAIQYLLPSIPTVLYAGLGRPQVELLTSLRRAAEKVWSSRSTASRQNIDFPTLFQEVLTLFDGAAGNFSAQRVQDELIGQMAELLQAEYDTLAFEISDSEHRWQALSYEPSPASELSAVPPVTGQIPVPGITGAEKAPSPPSDTRGSSTVKTPPTSATPVSQEDTGDGVDAAKLQEHIVSPAGTTDRLQSIQRLVADHTGETLQDFEHNVLQSVPVQAGGLYPITDVWAIEPALDDPERLRTHIAQFAREIAVEAGAHELIESSEQGIGFLCQPSDAISAESPHARAILALLHALSAPCLLPQQAGVSIDASLMTNQLGFLLLGPLADVSIKDTPDRLSDTALVKLFRLLRLARRLVDIESGATDGTRATSGS